MLRLDKFIQCLLVGIVGLVLSACGGSSDDSNASSSSSSSNSSSSSSTSNSSSSSSSSSSATTLAGVFVDSAVSGVNYLTKNANDVTTHTGVTGTAGEYNYEPGDTVNFFIGGMVFPTTTASDRVTPLAICNTTDFNDNCAVNVARLLQTLDSDGDASNGITLVTATADAAASGMNSNAIDFTVAPATFGADADVINLVANGGGSTSLVSAADAVAHVKSQTLVGSWRAVDGADSATFSFFADGTFVEAENSGSAAGMERGTYTWNAATGALTFSVAVDTQPETVDNTMGVSGTLTGNTWTISGDTATLNNNADETYTFTREPASAASAIVGTWYMRDTATGELVATVSFFDNGTYMHAQDSGDDNGMAGIELGTYNWDSGTGVLSATPTIDTNGEWGLSHPQGTLSIQISGDTLTFTESGSSDEPPVLTRLTP